MSTRIHEGSLGPTPSRPTAKQNRRSSQQTQRQGPGNMVDPWTWRNQREWKSWWRGKKSGQRKLQPRWPTALHTQRQNKNQQICGETKLFKETQERSCQAICKFTKIPSITGNQPLYSVIQVPQSVTFRNSCMTLLTNLGQFWILSHLSPPHHTHIKFHIGIHQVPNMLSHVLLTSVYSSQSVLLFYVSVQSRTIVHYCPVIVSCPDYCINNFIQEYPYVSFCV